MLQVTSGQFLLLLDACTILVFSFANISVIVIVVVAAGEREVDRSGILKVLEMWSAKRA